MKVLNFTNIAKLIREARAKKHWSQSDLGALAGMKRGQGQAISNIERGLCNLPPKRGPRICQILDIEPGLMIEAMVEDYRTSLVAEFEKASSSGGGH